MDKIYTDYEKSSNMRALLMIDSKENSKQKGFIDQVRKDASTLVGEDKKELLNMYIQTAYELGITRGCFEMQAKISASILSLYDSRCK